MTLFSTRTLDYLFELSNNNHKQWFEDNRERYEQFLLEPFRKLVEALTPAMRDVDAQLETRPMIGKTLSRMHRDVRFSKDKSPYRPAMWLAFARKDKDCADLPGFFFEVTPFMYRFGVGCYAASKRMMDSYRRLLLDEVREFKSIAAAITQPKMSMRVCGELYKRPLKVADLAEEMQTWYQRKELYLMCEQPPDELLFSSNLAEQLTAQFTMAAPLYDFLRRAAEKA